MISWQNNQLVDGGHYQAEAEAEVLEQRRNEAVRPSIENFDHYSCLNFGM